MRAVVISGSSPQAPGQEASWGALSPLVDRPFLQHVVESAVGQGIREMSFLLRAEDQMTRKVLGDGTRWGAQFRYHLVTGSASIYSALRQIPMKGGDERVLLAHADRLPLLALDDAVSETTLFCWREGKLHWTGWGLVRAGELHRAPKGLDEQGLLAFLMKSHREVVCTEGQRPLTARSYEDVIDANRRVLSREFPALLFSGREVQPGVWMGRNVSVHPTAKVSAPAFLGENCRIGALAKVGPAASIGKDCLIERETQVTDSVVYGGSYVGRQLALRGVVVDRSRLFSTRWDAEIEDVDELLLGCVFGTSVKTRVQRLCGRVAGAIALILAAPCLGAMFLGSTLGLLPGIRKQAVVRAPTVSGSYRWKTFTLWSFGAGCSPTGKAGWIRHAFFCFLPALLPITAGYLGLGGPKPRTKDEVENLPRVKRAAYLRSRPGILQLGAVSPETNGDLSDFEIAETGWGEAMAVMARYCGRVLRSCFYGAASIPERRKA